MFKGEKVCAASLKLFMSLDVHTYVIMNPIKHTYKHGWNTHAQNKSKREAGSLLALSSVL